MVQSRTRLSPSDRQKLDHTGVKHLDYVSKNTYLCQYQDGDLGKIRQLESVVFVDSYQKKLKITPSLEEAEQDQFCKVDIVFHESVNPYSPDLQSDIMKKSHRDMGDIKFLPRKARLTIQRLYVDAVASIDDVRRIEEVGEVVMYNTVAR